MFLSVSSHKPPFLLCFLLYCLKNGWFLPKVTTTEACVIPYMATTLFNHAGKCPNMNFGKCLLENVLNSSVEKVRHCRTNSTPKKQHIWHFPGSGFLVGNSPSLLNGVGNLPSTVIYYWKMFDSHKQYRWDFLAAGKCATVICSIDKAFVTLENVLLS